MMLRLIAVLCMMMWWPAHAAPLDDIQASLKAGQFDTAIPRLRKLAEAGDGTAQFALATVLEGAFGNPARDPAEAVQWYRRAADQGIPQAQTALADRVVQGIGAEKNYEEAAKLYRAAADKIPQAAAHLGDLYCYGVGVKEDGAECAKWYLKAAEAGDTHAQAALGGLYAVGNGVEKNDTEADKWLLRAAEGGDVLGQYGIAQAYRSGAGLKQDYVQAYVWLAVAGANPGAAAFGSDMQKAIREDLDDTAAHLTPSQKAEAEKLIGARVAGK